MDSIGGSARHGISCGEKEDEEGNERESRAKAEAGKGNEKERKAEEID